MNIQKRPGKLSTFFVLRWLIAIGLFSVAASGCSRCGHAPPAPAIVQASQPVSQAAASIPMEQPQPQPQPQLSAFISVNGSDASGISPGLPLIIEADWPEPAPSDPAVRVVSELGVQQNWPLRKLDAPGNRPTWVLSPGQTAGIAAGVYLITPAASGQDEPGSPIAAQLTVTAPGNTPDPVQQNFAARLRVRYHLLVGETEAANAIVAGELERQPDSIGFWILRGDLLVQGKQFEAGAKAYARALELRSGQAPPDAELPQLLMDKWRSAALLASRARGSSASQSE